ncbi:hypothetical protein [uncultured Ruminococcus sp.]|uniref:hypothetical protein n=1 Tax=uncultured Ruminococcus sp. TaxID=165186 RepID=UPI0025EA0FC0|nr:hypothetical protein [uncultured Ruminococcus sp.]
MKKENISEIRRSLEPSAEMKHRVMERAAKLEAGRKTFGNEKTTSDGSTTAEFGTKEKKEQTTMSVNRSDMIKVKSHLPTAVISAAACAAVVIGIAAVNINKNDPKPLPTTNQDSMTTDDETVTKDETVTEDEDLSPEEVMTVIEGDFSTYTITGRDRIAAINELVEKAKNGHVCDIEVPIERRLEYYVDGKKRIVVISEVTGCPEEYHPDSDPHVELCRFITVDGATYALCEFTQDEPYADLYWATSKDTGLAVKRWDDDDYLGYNDDTFALKLRDIIEDIRENGTPQFETEVLPCWDQCEQLPPWSEVSVSFNFCIDGRYYDVDMFTDPGMILTTVHGCRDDKVSSVLYNNAQDWTAELNEVIDELENSYGSEYHVRKASWSQPYNESLVCGYVRIPGIADDAGSEYISFPVAQKDPYCEEDHLDFFLSHDWAGEPSDDGNIFPENDEMMVCDKELYMDCTALYGKNTGDKGTMFTHLLDYNDGTGDKLNECPVIEFGTIWDEELPQYVIIGAGTMDLSSNNAFDFRTYDIFYDEDCDVYDEHHSFDTWMKGLKDSCTIMRDIDCTADDDFLTLSTPVDAGDANGERFVVFARKLRDGEQLPNNVFKVIGKN